MAGLDRKSRPWGFSAQNLFPASPYVNSSIVSSLWSLVPPAPDPGCGVKKAPCGGEMNQVPRRYCVPRLITALFLMMVLIRRPPVRGMKKKPKIRSGSIKNCGNGARRDRISMRKCFIPITLQYIQVWLWPNPAPGYPESDILTTSPGPPFFRNFAWLFFTIQEKQIGSRRRFNYQFA